MLRKVNRDVLLWAILFWGAVTLIVIAPLAGWTYLKLTGGGVNLFRDIHEVD